ncbi:thioredoxin domain-containing protein [Myxosarcina sp. GI1]|uniref:thioredoxin domain-containing protein n=1 Tax=Myxosarcina sp. GI1 TaxID=1541065 RepID=UPI000563CE2C|nr:thioredoxin domain-containing protein [Myxosarcina sp. GI1]
MPNQLANTQSLYLRKHADNPIDWWYWCDEALELAKQNNKPIFLSIGYSSCHWCTVMEGEAFSDEAIASYLNTNFLPIKVDREERPDIDSIYMQALQMMIGQGGWPLNIFLTPDKLIPFYGGTYFPVEPKYGRPGFLEILQAVRRFYDKETEKLENLTEEIFKNLQQSTNLPTGKANILSEELLNRGMETNTAVLSPNDFGRPSFPMIPYAALALQNSQQESSEYNATELARQRGLDLVLGGIFDHVGGGFHRYTVDSTWTVPHFEKMLYDNGQILEYLANLWSSGFQKPAIERAIALTVEWLKREMTSAQGGLYAAQDADNFTTPQAAEPEEGEFYVWSYQELTDLLSSEELSQLQAEFTVTPEGNFEGKNVLQRLGIEQLSETLNSALAKLFAVRYGKAASEIDSFPPAKNNREAKSKDWLGRIPPVTDTKTIVAWNSLVISGLARAYSVFKEQSYLDLAIAVVEFILDNQWQSGRLHRLNYDDRVSVLAQSEDYALLIKALLDLQMACPQDARWLEKAIALQQEFDRFFWSEEGGYYNNAADGGKELLIRERSYMDNATPAANGTAVANLVRLGLLTEDTDYLERAETALKAFSTIMERSPQACPSLFVALDWLLNGTLVKTTAEQLAKLIPNYFPTTAFRLEPNLPQGAVGLVCRGLSCLEPATSERQLLKQLTMNS